MACLVVVDDDGWVEVKSDRRYCRRLTVAMSGKRRRGRVSMPLGSRGEINLGVEEEVGEGRKGKSVSNVFV